MGKIYSALETERQLRSSECLNLLSCKILPFPNTSLAIRILISTNLSIKTVEVPVTNYVLFEKKHTHLLNGDNKNRLYKLNTFQDNVIFSQLRDVP